MKEKLPFGIIFGINLIACFYLTTAFVTLYIVLNGVEAQTGGSITMFEHWYQILVSLQSILLILISLKLFILLLILKFILIRSFFIIK